MKVIYHNIVQIHIINVCEELNINYYNIYEYLKDYYKLHLHTKSDKCITIRMEKKNKTKQYIYDYIYRLYNNIFINECNICYEETNDIVICRKCNYKICYMCYLKIFKFNNSNIICPQCRTYLTYDKRDSNGGEALCTKHYLNEGIIYEGTRLRMTNEQINSLLFTDEEIEKELNEINNEGFTEIDTESEDESDSNSEDDNRYFYTFVNGDENDDTFKENYYEYNEEFYEAEEIEEWFKDDYFDYNDLERHHIISDILLKELTKKESKIEYDKTIQNIKDSNIYGDNTITNFMNQFLITMIQSRESNGYYSLMNIMRSNNNLNETGIDAFNRLNRYNNE